MKINNCNLSAMVQDEANNEGGFSVNDGGDFSNRDEGMVDTGVANISVGGPTPSHQVCRVQIFFSIISSCVRTHRLQKCMVYYVSG